MQSLQNYSPDRIVTVAENNIGYGVYPETHVLKSTRIFGCTLVSIYNQQDKVGSLVHFTDDEKLWHEELYGRYEGPQKPDGKIAGNLEEWIIAMLLEGRRKINSVVGCEADVDYRIMAKTWEREKYYSKRENRTLEIVCGVLETDIPKPFPLDFMSYGGLYLENGKSFWE